MRDSKLLRPQDVAEMLGITTHTLAVWRCEGRYDLPYIKVGRLVRYEMTAVIAFMRRNVYQRGAEG